MGSKVLMYSPTYIYALFRRKFYLKHVFKLSEIFFLGEISAKCHQDSKYLQQIRKSPLYYAKKLFKTRKRKVL